MIPKIPGLKYKDQNSPFIIAGPCVIENKEMLFEIAKELVDCSDCYKIPIIFKASYRKANRSKYNSFTGIGDEVALEFLMEVKHAFDISVLTDFHSVMEAFNAGKCVDVLQVPALLSRQTDMLEAAANAGSWVNIKKGQFMSGDSIYNVINKLMWFGTNKIIITERGNTFGYDDIVVDMRNIPKLKKLGYPVAVDVTHPLDGDQDMIETLAMASIAAGADGIFIEVHPDPKKAKSDGNRMFKLNRFTDLVIKLQKVYKAINS